MIENGERKEERQILFLLTGFSLLRFAVTFVQRHQQREVPLWRAGSDVRQEGQV